MHDQEWKTTEDLAARYRTDPGTVRYWRHVRRGPPGTRFGRRILYRMADVLAWEAQQEAAPGGRRGQAAAEADTEQVIREIVATAPPLTPEIRQRLAALLLSSESTP